MPRTFPLQHQARISSNDQRQGEERRRPRERRLGSIWEGRGVPASHVDCQSPSRLSLPRLLRLSKGIPAASSQTDGGSHTRQSNVGGTDPSCRPLPSTLLAEELGLSATTPLVLPRYLTRARFWTPGTGKKHLGENPCTAPASRPCPCACLLYFALGCVLKCGQCS